MNWETPIRKSCEVEVEVEVTASWAFKINLLSPIPKPLLQPQPGLNLQPQCKGTLTSRILIRLWLELWSLYLGVFGRQAQGVICGMDNEHMQHRHLAGEFSLVPLYKISKHLLTYHYIHTNWRKLHSYTITLPYWDIQDDGRCWSS